MMNKIRVCFLGTPVFAERCLLALLEDPHFEVVGVVTQPDRPSGRKLQLTPSPVKKLALDRQLPVITPESLKNEPDAVQTITSWGAEVAVVVAFGQILTDDFMGRFRLGCVNVHASLLPRWRGAAPIQRAIEAGDTVTGVCIQKMVKKLDAGDVIAERRMQIDDQMNSIQLHDELCRLSIELLKSELPDFAHGHLVGVSQDEAQVTYAKKIEKHEGRIDWNQSAWQIDCKIRAFAWGPGTFTWLNGKKVKITKAMAKEKRAPSAGHPGGRIVGFPLLDQNGQVIEVETGAGNIYIQELQPESKSAMKAADFLRGYNVQLNERFADDDKTP